MKTYSNTLTRLLQRACSSVMPTHKKAYRIKLVGFFNFKYYLQNITGTQTLNRLEKPINYLK